MRQDQTDIHDYLGLETRHFVPVSVGSPSASIQPGETKCSGLPMCNECGKVPLQYSILEAIVGDTENPGMEAQPRAPKRQNNTDLRRDLLSKRGLQACHLGVEMIMIIEENMHVCP